MRVIRKVEEEYFKDDEITMTELNICITLDH